MLPLRLLPRLPLLLPSRRPFYALVQLPGALSQLPGALSQLPSALKQPVSVVSWLAGALTPLSTLTLLQGKHEQLTGHDRLVPLCAVC